MSQYPKHSIPMDCPDCGTPTLSDEFFCSKCSEARRDERELDEEMSRCDEEGEK